MRSFNDIVYDILNENDGRSLPAMPASSPQDPGVYGPPERRGALAKRQKFLASGQLPGGIDEPSIGNMIYNLIESLDEDTKTNTGDRVTDVLEDILDELEDIKMSLKGARESGRDLNDYLSETAKLIRRL